MVPQKTRRKKPETFDKPLTNLASGGGNLALVFTLVMTTKRPPTRPRVHSVREIAAEMDHLFQRQLALMKSETLIGLTPSQRCEYEKVGQRIRELFTELAKCK
jgi:hypothetical protein